MNDDPRVREHLHAALDQLLAALVLSGGLSDHVPDDALDAVLASDPAVQDARRAVSLALSGLHPGQADGDPHQALLAVEAATNAYAARCADAAYRLGLRVGQGVGK